jgi:hypothetical protein
MSAGYRSVGFAVSRKKVDITYISTVKLVQFMGQVTMAIPKLSSSPGFTRISAQRSAQFFLDIRWADFSFALWCDCQLAVPLSIGTNLSTKSRNISLVYI